MLAFGIFIFSGSLLNVLSRTIDVIIITSQSAGGLKDTSVFVIATYMIQIMEVPQRSIVAIAIPIISQAWKDRNMKQISDLYKKTSLNLLIFGLAIWGALLLNMDNAIAFLGPAYEPAKMIVIIMGTAKIIDLGTGLNSQILLLSKYWRIDFITNMLFVLISIPLNYTLINHYGVIGSAFANLVALTVFNGIRFFYIWKLYKLQPLTVQTIYALIIALICFGITAIVPSFPNLFIDVAVKAIIYVGLFGSAILFFKVSEDLNGLFTQTLQRLKSR
jgi:O-antigen/teichoic acid export membrane protein